MCAHTYVRFDREARSGGGLVRVDSAGETHCAVLVWRGSGTFSLGVLSQA